MTATFIDVRAPLAARCESDGQTGRSAAARILRGALAPAAGLLAAAREACSRLGADVGRVLPGGSITEVAQVNVVRVSLRNELPTPLATFLRPSFEWYGCRGAAFHNDAHYGDVLFGAWYIDGPARDLVFPRIATRITASPGDWVVFDPFEPHAVLTPGSDRYQRDDYSTAAAASMFLAFEVELAEPVRNVFRVDPASEQAQLLASRVPIHAETGAIG